MYIDSYSLSRCTLSPPLKDQRKEERKNDNKNWFSINFWWHWSYYHHTSNKISLITNLIFNIYPQARRHHDLHYIERYMQWILLCIILYKPQSFNSTPFTTAPSYSHTQPTKANTNILNIICIRTHTWYAFKATTIIKSSIHVSIYGLPYDEFNDSSGERGTAKFCDKFIGRWCLL